MTSLRCVLFGAFGASLLTLGPARAQTEIGFVAGAAAYAHLGTGVANIGDVNGDGIADFAATALLQGGGAVTVYSGRNRAILRTIHVANAETVAPVGDLDQDGVPDFAVGAPSSNATAGSLTAFSGRTFGVLFSRVGLAQTYFGRAIARVSDLNQDGRDDIAVGAPGRDPGTGRSTVHFLSAMTGSTLSSASIVGDDGGYSLGWSLADLGDVDGDGRRELAVGARGFSGGGLAYRGAVFVWKPAIAGVQTIRQWFGSAAGERLGHAVAAAGSLNNDPYSEVLAGAPGDSAGTRAYVFVVTSNAPMYTFTSGAGNGFGMALAGIRDVDADGVPDLAVGAPHYENFRGAVVVYSGATGSILFTKGGAVGSGERFGAALAGLGDVDGDGLGDFATGMGDAATPLNQAGGVLLLTYTLPGRALPYGTGCAGQNGTPVLAASGRISLATTAYLSAQRFVANAPGLIFLGASRTNWGSLTLPLSLTPLGFTGCFLHASPELVVPVLASSSGVAYLQVRIPYDVSMVNDSVFLQAAMSDPRPGGLVFTNGLELRIGR
jgi:hypothetical protein